MNISSAKAKGRRHQQDIAKRILAMYPELEPDDVVSTSMGAGGEDLRLSPAARKRFNYSVECKATAKSTSQTYMDQATRNAPAGTVPIVVSKADRKQPLVTMTWADFERLVLK